MKGEETEYNNLAELVADLRNKLGSLTNYASLCDLLKDDSLSEDQIKSLEELKEKEHIRLLKSAPLVKGCLDSFEGYNLDQGITTLDLKQMEKQLDEALECETNESLTKWLGEQRG